MARAIGVDIGTGYITSAEQAGDEGKVEFRKVRDCFFKVSPEDFLGGANPMFGEKMLKKTGAHFMKVNDVLYILGDSAYKLAGTMHKETLRPMAKGVLNPNEPESAAMMSELVRAVAGNPTGEDDALFFCVPANPVDEDFDVEYHRETLKKTFSGLGYKEENIHVMNEGLAVVFSELADDDFTGIGISFGAGMVNVCYAFMGMPILSFSISKGGDYIDQSAAKQVDDTANTVCHHKEKMKSLSEPEGKYEEAVAIYYQTLLKYLVAQIKHLYSKTDKKDLPNLFDDVKVVVAGGTSLAGGFVEMLDKAIKDEKDFPIPVKEVKHAEEPLYSVSHGLFQAASLELGD